MNAQLQVVLIAAGCTSAVGVLGMGVIRLLRRAPLRLSVQVSGGVVVLAVVAGTLGTALLHFYPWRTLPGSYFLPRLRVHRHGI